jgi:hypothetical protein
MYNLHRDLCFIYILLQAQFAQAQTQTQAQAQGLSKFATEILRMRKDELGRSAAGMRKLSVFHVLSQS